jgi:predicted RNA-binding Zn-ribbon protein involved in translation (DUF1610 family)
MAGNLRYRRGGLLGFLALVAGLTALSAFGVTQSDPPAGATSGGEAADPERDLRVTCPSCGHRYRDRIRRSRASTLYVQCARCESVVDVYQPDSSGLLRRPPWFLPLEDRPAIDSPVELWIWVRNYIRYVKDGTGRRVHEVWQLPRETYRWRRGDCEDSALLLAEWLRYLGYEAYVAVGRVRGSGHAWVVLQDGDESYLLETTGSHGNNRRHPPLAKLLTGYNPTEFMFDDESVWVRRDKTWTADYRSSKHWLKLIWHE